MTRELLQRQLDIPWSFATAFVIDKVDPIALWAPSDHVVTVHRTGSGWVADWPDEENPPLPEPTVGWVLWHIEWWWSNAVRAGRGLPPLPPDEHRWSGSSQGLVPIRQAWGDLLAESDLDAVVAGLMPTPQPFAYVAAWVNIELMKNLAEINQLSIRHANTAGTPLD